MQAATGGGQEGHRATLTLKVVEDTERKVVEKYLTLEIAQISSILAATQTNRSTVFSPDGQKSAAAAIGDELSPALERLLADDYELMQFLTVHPELSDVDLVLLLEERVQVAVSSYSARVVAVLIVKSGLLDRVRRRSTTGSLEA
jgi:hypothetical protein